MIQPSRPDAFCPNRPNGLPSSIRATSSFIGKQIWLWPIVAALLLAGVGFWVNHTVGTAMREEMAKQLKTILDADVEAVKVWAKEQEYNAWILANAEDVKRDTEELLKLAGDGKFDAAALIKSVPSKKLHAYLVKRLHMIQYPNFFVVSPDYRVIGSTIPQIVGMEPKGYQKELVRKALSGQVVVSKPYQRPVALTDADGNVKVGVPTMSVLAPIQDEQKRVIAVLVLHIQPESTFTSIMQTARSGETGETYAFDRNGLMLSESRFDDDLKRAGLLPDVSGAQSVLTVELRDPGVNMVDGGRPKLTRAEQPLTHMAKEASQGGSGISLDGYRDYRGVPCIAAWQWVPEYDFGITTKIDVTEAYRPLYVLRKTFWGMFVLLFVAALAIFAFMMILARKQKQVQQVIAAATQLGQYTLENKIGEGGMGSVYRARHALLRRPTAIKILDTSKISADEGGSARFEREVQLTSQLNHPNTIAIYDYGRTKENVFFYAMEFLEGINLEDLVEKFGALPPGRVVWLLQQICGSLAEAHSIGLIHRDIKPANLFLTLRGGVPDFVKVLDFGLARAVNQGKEARLTQSNAIVGTPLYMSPESIEKPEAVDSRSDIYAIGAVGYWLLTGVPVFDGDTVVNICMQHLNAQPVPPTMRLGKETDQHLEAIIMWCLSKAPKDRPESAILLMDELAKCESADKWKRADAEAWWRAAKTPAVSQSGTGTPSPDSSMHPTIASGPIQI